MVRDVGRVVAEWGGGAMWARGRWSRDGGPVAAGRDGRPGRGSGGAAGDADGSRGWGAAGREPAPRVNPDRSSEHPGTTRI